jgi:hypothetical protein
MLIFGLSMVEWSSGGSCARFVVSLYLNLTALGGALTPHPEQRLFSPLAPLAYIRFEGGTVRHNLDDVALAHRAGLRQQFQLWLRAFQPTRVNHFGGHMLLLTIEII